MNMNPQLSPGQQINTAVEPTKRPNLAGYLLEGISGIMGSGKGSEDSPDTIALRDAALKRQEFDTAVLGEQAESEVEANALVDAGFGYMFKDAVVDPEEKKILDSARLKSDRLTSVTNPLQRKILLNQYRTDFLKNMPSGIKPETLEKVLKMYEIDSSEDPIKSSYTDELYKKVKDKFPNATPAHFAMEAALNRAQADRVVSKEMGEDTISNFSSTVPFILDKAMATAMLEVDAAWDKDGFVDSSVAAAFGKKVDEYYTDAMEELQSTVAAAVKSGAIVDQSEIKAAQAVIDSTAARWRDLTQHFKTDPSAQARMKEVLAFVNNAPMLATGKNIGLITELAYKMHIDWNTLTNLVKMPADVRAKSMRDSGIPESQSGSVQGQMDVIAQALQNLNKVGPDQVRDPALHKFMLYLAAPWAGVTDSPNGSTKAEPKAVEVVTDELTKEGTTPATTFAYLIREPGYTPNLLKLSPDKAPRIRNKLRADIEKLKRSAEGYIITPVKGGYSLDLRPNATLGDLRGPGGQDDLKKFSETAVAALQYLRTPEAQKLMGGDEELRDLEAFLSGRKVVRGETLLNAEDAMQAVARLDGMSNADVLDMQERLKKSVFNASPQDGTKVSVLQQAQIAVEAAVRSRGLGPKESPASTLKGRSDDLSDEMAAATGNPTEAAMDSQIKATRTGARGEYEQMADSVADSVNVPRKLLRAVVGAESSWDPAALSDKGAVGLAQVLVSTAEQHGISAEELRANPEKQLLAGAKHLAYILKYFKIDPEFATTEDVEIISAAYNRGHNAVRRGIEKYGSWDAFKKQTGKDALPQDTKDYIQKIRQGLRG